MSASEGSERKGSIRIPLPGETMLLAIIAIGFCVLHILTAAFLLSPSETRTAAPSQVQTLAHYD
jgi:hypothetical protein